MKNYVERILDGMQELKDTEKEIAKTYQDIEKEIELMEKETRKDVCQMHLGRFMKLSENLSELEGRRISVINRVSQVHTIRVCELVDAVLHKTE